MWKTALYEGIEVFFPSSTSLIEVKKAFDVGKRNKRSEEDRLRCPVDL